MFEQDTDRHFAPGWMRSQVYTKHNAILARIEEARRHYREDRCRGLLDRQPPGRRRGTLLLTLMRRAALKAAHPERTGLTVADIRRLCAEEAGISLREMLSHRRPLSLVRPRQIGMYLAKKLTSRSLPEIGKRFGGRDHSSVLYAVRKITALLDAGDEYVTGLVGRVMARLASEGLV